MRVEQITLSISLVAMLPLALVLFASRKKVLKGFSITFTAMIMLDLVANLTGLGEYFWWSPLHWPSMIILGVDEIVENYGVAVTTIGYIVDIIIWSVFVAGVVRIMKRKKAPHNTPAGIRQAADGSLKTSA